ncbi:unnamed protein product, partial [Rotaria socialis]
MNVSMWPYAFEGLYQHNRSGTLDSSSGYESANNDTSIVETYAVTHARSEHYRYTKRRMLSCTQREEANRRERHRMEIINQAYEDLRNVLPSKKGRKRQKMSRMDTVDGAIQYIHTLLETLQAVGDAAENQLMSNSEIQKALKPFNISTIDEIILVGGSTRIPKVLQLSQVDQLGSYTAVWDEPHVK